ncbi:unnamed protein product [Didymodactylos carnosus]|uniref:Uncharacterized protein n=1 Tax=Didymodactylos carnosus TaxID=1234261 RepID=A0A8S2H0H4_9BILA|nr:unnamed protein product [Didymodactylos carnosus]CAF3576343.1 unnamed protein product [Didymodactylos carnosus]
MTLPAILAACKTETEKSSVSFENVENLIDKIKSDMSQLDFERDFVVSASTRNFYTNARKNLEHGEKINEIKNKAIEKINESFQLTFTGEEDGGTLPTSKRKFNLMLTRLFLEILMGEEYANSYIDLIELLIYDSNGKIWNADGKSIFAGSNLSNSQGAITRTEIHKMFVKIETTQLKNYKNANETAKELKSLILSSIAAASISNEQIWDFAQSPSGTTNLPPVVSLLHGQWPIN